MAKAKDAKEYALGWKNEVSSVLYGPVADIYAHKELATEMRNAVTVLCGLIDKTSEILDKEGVFNGQ